MSPAIGALCHRRLLMPKPSQALLDELIDWLRIPSISTGEPDPAAMARAAEWVCERVAAAGGTAVLDDSHGGNPLAVGELGAADAAAPTVLIYGHYDVQSPGDLTAWSSPPFEPEVRERRIYARGAADDKGNFLPLLHVACELAREGALPVNVRILVEGEEEVGGGAVSRWIRADERGADCAIVFDAGPADERTPAITVGLRGIVMVEIEVRTAPRHLHSGQYGGSVLNSLHVLHAMISEVVPGPDGRLSEELRAGIEPPSEAELASWEQLRPGDEVIAEAGGRPLGDDAGSLYYRRNGAEPSLDVNEITGGEARTVVPANARATLSMRLAPGQSAGEMAATLERLLRAGAPEGAQVELAIEAHDPALCDPRVRGGAACGRRPEPCERRRPRRPGPRGRLDPRRRRPARRGDSGDRQRLQPPRRRDPRARRVLRAAEPGLGRALRPRTLCRAVKAGPEDLDHAVANSR